MITIMIHDHKNCINNITNYYDIYFVIFLVWLNNSFSWHYLIIYIPRSHMASCHPHPSWPNPSWGKTRTYRTMVTSGFQRDPAAAGQFKVLPRWLVFRLRLVAVARGVEPNPVRCVGTKQPIEKIVDPTGISTVGPRWCLRKNLVKNLVNLRIFNKWNPCLICENENLPQIEVKVNNIFETAKQLVY